MFKRAPGLATVFVLFALIQFALPAAGNAGTAKEIDAKVSAALSSLKENNKAARTLGEKAKAVLVFPDIVKGGLIVGGQFGEGAMRDPNNKTVGYYNTVAASYGLQFGGQTFGYAMFMMTDSAVTHVKNTDGWEVGSGPSIVVVEKGAATDFTTTSAQEDIYVFFFNQQGMMAGLGIQGTKVSPIEPD